MAIFEEAMNEVALGDEQASFEWEAVFGPGGGGAVATTLFPPDGPTCFPAIDRAFWLRAGD